MSQPRTVWDYLVEFNACLDTGFRSRRRIFLEVSDHLRQRVETERQRGVRRELAEQRAIAVFGSPQEVARGFQRGAAGALDTRLARATRRMDTWAACHPLATVVPRIILLALLAAAAGAVASLVGAQEPWAATSVILSVGVLLELVSVAVGAHVREAPLRDWLTILDGRCLVWLLAATWLSIVDASTFIWVAGTAACYLCFWSQAKRTIERVVELAARRPAPDTIERQRWDDEHPFVAALLDIWSLPSAAIVMVLAYPAPLELRGAFAGLVAATALLTAGAACLVRNLERQKTYALRCELSTPPEYGPQGRTDAPDT
jgi:hypothetical protein